MTKLKDVADYLNLSISTVSRVVNNYDRVDEKTRKRVEEAIKKLNYYPNVNARRLKKNSSDIIGVIVPDITNPFFASVVRGVQHFAIKSGYTVLLCDTNSNIEYEKNSVSVLSRQNVAGIITATIASNNQVKKIYSNIGNVVFIDNIPSDDRFSSVSINNFNAAKDLVDILVKNSHKKIATIAGPKSESSSLDRLNGYIQALKDNRIPVDEEYIYYGDYSLKSGYEKMKELLKLNKLPTALFAANNFMAYGAIQAIWESGLAVPEDITVATFDVFDNTGLIKNKLISVIQPSFDIGSIAAEICINKSKNNMIKHSNKITLNYKIDTFL